MIENKKKQSYKFITVGKTKKKRMVQVVNGGLKQPLKATWDRSLMQLATIHVIYIKFVMQPLSFWHAYLENTNCDFDCQRP